MTDALNERREALVHHHRALRTCCACPNMTGPPVIGTSVLSPVLLMGQAPGTREIQVDRPFAWTAGQTLFGWFERIGFPEHRFRERVFMTAVCRCFPGKNPKGGDRMPSRTEVANCTRWWQRELELVRPRLIIPVGRMAISRFVGTKRLDDIVGKPWSYRLEDGATADLIPLPHPSGVSTWFKLEPGKTLLSQALSLIDEHPAWCQITGT